MRGVARGEDLALPAAAAARGPERPNPFVFPSSTDARFYLLVVTVASACLLTYNRLAARASEPADVVATLLRCNGIAEQEAEAFGRRTAAALTDTATQNRAARDMDRHGGARRRCRAPLAAQQARWTGGGVLLLLAVAAAGYWAAPAWITRRRRLLPLPSEADAPGLAGALHALCAEAGLGARPPTFLVAPFDRSATGLAFGRNGRYVVALGAGLVARFYGDRPAFRAVVLHELAHLRNNDVAKAYFTLAAGYAFVAVALVPDLVTTPTAGEPARWAVERLGRVVALAALVYLTRNAALRAREVYADVRASTWDGPGGALGRVLERLPALSRPWHRYVLTHPEPGRRRQLLGDTRPLFASSVSEAVATGLAATLAFAGVQALARQLIEARAGDSTTIAPLVGVAVVGPLVAGVLGVGAWRRAFAALLRGDRPRGTRPVALGFVAGCLLSSVSGFDRVTTVELFDALRAGGAAGDGAVVGVGWVGLGYLIWGAIAFAALVLLLRWVEVGAVTWLTASAEPPRTRLALALTCGLFGVTLAVLLPSLALFESTGTGPLAAAGAGVGMPLVVLGMTLVHSATALPSALTVAALATLWAYPFAAVLRARAPEDTGPAAAAGAAGAPWASLDATPLVRTPQPMARPTALPAPRTAWRLGLAALVPCAGLLLVAHVGWWWRLEPAVRDTPNTKGELAWLTVAIVVLCQAAVAAVTARRVPVLGVVHGLCAAFVTASGAALVTVALFAALRGRGADLGMYFLVTYLFAGALPAAGAAWVAGALRRAGPRP